MAFKKILVAIDRSSQAPVVFEQALDLAQVEESQLMLFHCIDPESQAETIPFIGTVTEVDLYETLHRLQQEHLQQELEKARDWLQSYCQKASLKNSSTEFDCIVGDPNRRICELAKSWDADLIVLGRRGYRGLSEFFLGSVSNYVLHHASCSVLVVQQELSPTPEPVGIATQSTTDTSL
ncbi:MAG TPA: universal stress protein [Coleofasciculaceae cyanobacterium]